MTSMRRFLLGAAVALLASLTGLRVCDAADPDASQPVVRPSDSRPRHDDRKLASLGIRVYESKRLKLYTDIDPAVAKTLPAYVDSAYDAWVAYFGALPPDRERAEFQMTGYLMSGKPLFREAGLIPANLPDFINGRHRGAEFWMVDSKFDYYRRHLMIHEATHCYMTILGGPLPPVWYMEGMAELFGTHRVEKEGKISFRVMPENQTDYAGLGRIQFVRDEVAAGREKTLDEVLAIRPVDFVRNDAYAWSWALCRFLDGHPRWQKPFRQLSGRLTYREFRRRFQEDFGAAAPQLRLEWLLYIRSLQEGFDSERAAVVFRPEVQPAGATLSKVEIDAARGWQSTGLLLEAGRDYELTASGSFQVANSPKPWISEPQGVSVRYNEGRPLGQLIGWMGSETRTALAVDDEKADGSQAKSPAAVSPQSEYLTIGRGRVIRPEKTGILFLRVNDAWNALDDNSGTLAVSIRRVP